MQKLAAALVKANIRQFLSKLSKSISWDSPFNKDKRLMIYSNQILWGVLIIREKLLQRARPYSQTNELLK